jgi:hypothetical protein
MEFKIDRGCFVRDISLDIIDAKPAVYRWWFDVIPEIVLQGGVNVSLIQSMTVKGVKLYALYVGKAANAQNRLRNHLPHSSRQTFRTSTLRRTLRALLCKPSQSDEECSNIVNQFMTNHAYLEWSYYASDEEAKHYESAYISNGYYPLNNSENIDSLKIWTRQMTILRKQWSEIK